MRKFKMRIMKIINKIFKKIFKKIIYKLNKIFIKKTMIYKKMNKYI